ncbi:MAG: sugar phosphate isomerase/epimerase [Armatimonadetes bacterium]|nr:sugar phosphate isomerase/epimerase [Armatimonadota bacterium]
MNKIGIMQGRIYPARVDKLQVFPSNHWKNEFYEAKKLGFDYIELLYDVGVDKFNPLGSSKNLNKILETVNSSQLELHSICADYFTMHNLLSTSDKESWKKLAHLIDCAQKLSISEIIIPFFDRNILNKTMDLEKFLYLANDEIEKAYNNGICLCIETTLKANNLLSIFKKTCTKAKICYDLGNAVAMGYKTDKEIELICDYIDLIHIKDRKKNGGANVLIGEGDVDFTLAFSTLKKIGYKGNFTLETAIGNNPRENAKKHIDKIKKLMDSL